MRASISGATTKSPDEERPLSITTINRIAAPAGGLPAVGASVFVPSILTNILVQWSAADLLLNQGFVADDEITAWANVLAAPRTLGATAPTKNKLVVAGLNGQPIVNFDGTQTGSGILAHDAGGDFVADFAVFFVARSADILADYSVGGFTTVPNGDINNYIIAAFIGGVTNWKALHKFSVGTVLDATPLLTDTNWHVFVLRGQDSSDTPAGIAGGSLFIDGVKEDQNAGVSFTAASTRTFVLGARWRSVGSGTLLALKGDIAETLIYSSSTTGAVLTDAQIATIAAELATHYGL